ncbi:MAG: LacI family transcriptional regulator, partial [Actinomycetota bacterium]|nr:LacI family transcriptional regulator [Actinomycetota bacterium]
MSTIAEVAMSAGVGVGTVSRVLNDSPEVRPATRLRVLAAIDDLGYRPNRAARALAGGRTRTIGVLAPFFTQPSAVERLRGVAEVLATSAHDLVLLDVASPAQRDDHVRRLLAAGPVDGLLVLSLPLPPRVRREVPVVLVDSRAPGVAGVWVDDVRGGRLAAEHLLDLGHRRVAFVGDEAPEGSGFTSSAHRLEGFADALAGAGAP